jgi:hypothetical protein
LAKQTAERAAADAKVNALAANAGFPSGFDLVLHSSGAIEALRQVATFEEEQRIARGAKRKLQAVNGHAMQLERALAALDQPSRELLAKTDSFARSGLLSLFVEDVEHIRDVAAIAQASLVGERAGRPSEPRVRFALRELYGLYHEQHPESRGFRCNPIADDEFEGQFFEFICQLFTLLGIKRKSLRSIGKQIQLALAQVANMPTDNMPKKK